MRTLLEVIAPPRFLPDGKCLCGHPPTPQPAGSCGTGYAYSPETGSTSCYACADQKSRIAMADRRTRGGTVHAYLSLDGRSLTTWNGGHLATVVASRRIGHPWKRKGDEFQAFTVEEQGGWQWYGRGSPGMAVTVRYKGRA